MTKLRIFATHGECQGRTATREYPPWLFPANKAATQMATHFGTASYQEARGNQQEGNGMDGNGYP